jgi:hypothetical protein
MYKSLPNYTVYLESQQFRGKHFFAVMHQRKNLHFAILNSKWIRSDTHERLSLAHELKSIAVESFKYNYDVKQVPFLEFVPTQGSLGNLEEKIKLSLKWNMEFLHC